MKIGVLSDSHDNLAKIEEAVKFFNNKKVKFVFHAGDFVAPFTIPKFKKLNCPWLGVLGNNDGEEKGLLRFIFQPRQGMVSQCGCRRETTPCLPIAIAVGFRFDAYPPPKIEFGI